MRVFIQVVLAKTDCTALITLALSRYVTFDYWLLKPLLEDEPSVNLLTGSLID